MSTFLMPRRVALVLFSLLFSAVSWHYLSSFYFLGSHEATSLLTKRPVIMDWDKFKVGEPRPFSSLVEPDTFITYGDGQGPHLVSSPGQRPSLYVKGSKEIYPIYIQERTGGLPYIMVRTLTQITGDPLLGLSLFTWMCSFGSFVLGLLYIQRHSGLGLPFAILASLVPQAYFYLYSQYPDSGLSFFLTLLTLFLVDWAEKRKHYALAGVIVALNLYIKLASIIYLPAMIILHGKKLWGHKKFVLMGLLPGVTIILALLMGSEIRSVVVEQREFFKPVGFILRVLSHFLMDLTNPDLLFPYLLNGDAVIPEIIRRHGGLFFAVSLATLLAVITLMVQLLPARAFKKMALVFVIHILFISALATEMNDDLYDYMAQGAYFLLILTMSFLVMKNNKKIVLASFLVLLIARGAVFVNWNSQYKKLAHSMGDCTWLYQCILQDIQHLGKDKPVVTLNLLDVGQFEYLSRETVLPIHVLWKLKRPPTEEELTDFLKRFPAQEFWLLESGPPDGKELSDYVSDPMSLLSQGLSLETAKIYDYPELGKTYKLINVKKKD